MDPLVEKLLAGLVIFVGGIVVREVIVRFFKRQDELKAAAKKTAGGARAAERKAVREELHNVNTKLDQVLKELAESRQQRALDARDIAQNAERVEALRSRIDGGLKNHADRIEKLERFQIQQETMQEQRKKRAA